VPLFLAFAIIAVVVALIFTLSQREAGQGKRFLGTAAAVWVALVVLAVIVLTVATSIFGR
jgi:hypothetical protein